MVKKILKIWLTTSNDRTDDVLSICQATGEALLTANKVMLKRPQLYCNCGFDTQSSAFGNGSRHRVRDKSADHGPDRSVVRTK